MLVHLLSKLFEMGCDFGNLRLALQSKLCRELWKCLVLSNVADAEQLAFDGLSRRLFARERWINASTNVERALPDFEKRTGS